MLLYQRHYALVQRLDRRDRLDISALASREVLGVLCAWDRVEAHAAARKHAAAAELIRRRLAPGHAPEGPARDAGGVG